MKDIFLSVILPCRNQGDHIGEVLQRYAQPLDNMQQPWELVVVPNASSDNTNKVVRDLAATDERIRIVENPIGGWGLSVRMGLAAARGKHLCYTNSARTTPDQIVRLMDIYQTNQPCLAKARREQRGVLIREIGSWLYNLEGRFLFQIAYGDVNGTPKMFSRELLSNLQLISDGDLLDLELMAKVKKMLLPVVELNITGFERHGGKSTTKVKSAWRMYLGAFELWRILRLAAKS